MPRPRPPRRRPRETLPEPTPLPATIPSSGPPVPATQPPPVPAVTIRLPEETTYIPPFLQEFGQQRPADISTFLQRYRQLMSRLAGAPSFIPRFLGGEGPSIAGIEGINVAERLAQGPAQMAAIYHGLGVDLGQQFPGSIFGTAPAGVPPPARSREYWSRVRQLGGLGNYVRIAKRLMSMASEEPLYDPGAYYPGGTVGGGGTVVVRGGGTPGSRGRSYSSGLINWRIG